MTIDDTLPAPKTLVLVIDDELLIRRVLRRILQHHGYRVLDAADGPAGLALVEAHPEIGAVILDIMMPNMTGLEVREAIRARRPGLPILLSSARAEMAPSDCEAFLVKPYAAQELLVAIESLLARA